MSFNPVCKPSELAKLKFKDYKPEVAKFVKKMYAKGHTHIGSLVPIFLNVEHKFADGDEAMFIVAGKLNAWKTHIKSAVSGDAAKVLKGYAFVLFSEETGYELKIAPVKGKMRKETILDKAFKKLVGTKAVINLLEEMEENEDFENQLESIVDTDTPKEQPANPNSTTEPEQETEEVRAKKILKQIAALIQQVRKDKNPNDINQLKTLATELYAIPTWKDFTPDEVEKNITALANAGKETEENKLDKANVAQYTQGILNLWADLKTTQSQQQVLRKIQSMAQGLQKIPNWRAYTDDRIEKALENAAAALKKIDDTLAPYEEKFKSCATIEQMQAEVQRVEQENPTGLLKTYVEEIKEDIQCIIAINQYINECLDTQEEAQKLLEQSSDEVEKQELAELIEAISQEIQAILE